MSKESPDYYSTNADSFIERSLKADMSEVYAEFTALIPLGGKVLELGCGAGRDLLYFAKKGFDSIGLEPNEALANHARTYSSRSVIEQNFEDTRWIDAFDGIWACASLLHMKKVDLPNIFSKVSLALKEDGIFYCSFKKGSFEGERDGRYFCDLTMDNLSQLVLENTKLKPHKVWETTELRESGDQVWVNGIFKK